MSTVLNVTGGLLRWLYCDELFRSMFSLTFTAIALICYLQDPIRAFLRIGIGG